MKGFLLDTNVTAALMNPEGAPSAHRFAGAIDESLLFISVLTLAEYDKGIANLPSDHPNRHRYGFSLAALERRFTNRILSLSDTIVRRWGAISGAAKLHTGHSPPVIDTMLAATALEHDLYLATRNVRDVARSGAAVFDPWTDDLTRFPVRR